MERTKIRVSKAPPRPRPIMERDLGRLRYGTAREQRLYKSNGNHGPIRKRNLIRTDTYDRSKRRRENIPLDVLSLTRATRRNYLGPRYTVCEYALEESILATRDHTKTVNGIPPRDGRSNGENESDRRNVPSYVH